MGVSSVFGDCGSGQSGYFIDEHVKVSDQRTDGGNSVVQPIAKPGRVDETPVNEDVASDWKTVLRHRREARDGNESNPVQQEEGEEEEEEKVETLEQMKQRWREEKSLREKTETYYVQIRGDSGLKLEEESKKRGWKEALEMARRSPKKGMTSTTHISNHSQGRLNLNGDLLQEQDHHQHHHHHQQQQRQQQDLKGATPSPVAREEEQKNDRIIVPSLGGGIILTTNRFGKKDREEMDAPSPSVSSLYAYSTGLNTMISAKIADNNSSGSGAKNDEEERRGGGDGGGGEGEEEKKSAEQHLQIKIEKLINQLEERDRCVQRAEVGVSTFPIFFDFTHLLTVHIIIP